MAEVIVLELHKNLNYVDECCDLLNAEWPRSKVARMRSLQVSRDGLPTCLILLHDNVVIGHSKISPIPSEPLACFIESVVIQPCKRGKGFGKLLMLQSENYAKKLGKYTVYLTTKDQVGFYAKLGYDICEPVSLYGCNITLGRDFYSNKSAPRQTPVQDSISSARPSHCPENVNMAIHDLKKLSLGSQSPTVFLPPPPPPPPPPPQCLEVCKASRSMPRPIDNCNKVFMKKCV